MASDNAAPAVSTFDLDPPRRPASEDFNGVAKIDEEGKAPNPQTMPNAPEWNLIEFLLLAAGRVMASAVVSVTNTGSPVVSSVACPSSLLSTSDFTPAHTGTGNVLISWGANALPPPSTKPTASLNAGPGMIHCALEGTGVRVHTYDATGTPADLSFTVQIW